MKKYFLLLFLSLASISSFSATYFAIKSGVWQDPTLWSLTRGGAAAGATPGTGDDAYTDGFNVISSGVTVRNLYVRNSFASGLVVSGTVTIEGLLAGHSINKFGFGVDGLDFPTTATISNSGGSLLFTGTALNSNSFGLSSNEVIAYWNNQSPLPPTTISSAGSVMFARIGQLSGFTEVYEELLFATNLILSSGDLITDESTMTGLRLANGTLSVGAGASFDLTVGLNEDGTPSSNINVVTVAGVMTIGTSAYLNTDNLNLNSGSLFTVLNNETNGWFHSTASGPAGGTIDPNSTVAFARAGNQGVFARTYGNLSISSGGTPVTKTLSSTGTLTVQGDLSIGTSTTFSTSSNTNNIVFGGNLTNDGVFAVTRPTTFNGGGTQIIGGASAITFSSTATFSNAMNIDTDVTFSSTVSCGSNNLSFAGDITNNGTFNCTGTITIDGPTNQSIAGSSQTIFNNLTISNTASSTATINGTGSSVEGALTLSANSGFNANGLLTLVSDAGATARVATIPGTASFTGNVIYQRYINGAQQWHNIGLPIAGSTADIIASSYPDPDASLSGDFARYNESTAGDLNQGWEISKTLPFSAISDTQGYSFWTRTANTPNTLEITGPLNTGNVSLNVSRTDTPAPAADDGWNLVNNPYASQIDWASGSWTKTSIDATIYVWNPAAGGGVGAYISPTTIASGQSFWVHATGASPVLTATQAVKTSGAATFYRITEPEIINELSITLIDNETTDITKIGFKADATEEFDTQYDGYKLQNGIFNLASITEAGLDLSINNIPMIDCNRIVKLNITNITEGTYQLKFDGLLSFDAGYQFTLKDNFLNTTTTLDEGMIHGFAVTTDAASWGNARFEIELSPANLDTSILYEVVDACNFSSSLTITNALVGVTYVLQQNGVDLVTKVATSQTLLLPLTESQVIAGLNQFDLTLTNGVCGISPVKSNAIEFTVTPIDPDILQYESTTECDLSTELIINNAQVGVTYGLMQNGIILSTVEATSSELIFPLISSQVVDGLNQFDLDLTNGSCPNAFVQNALEFTTTLKQEITSFVDNESCGAGQVLLSASGATGNAYYNWYESIEAVDPIPNQNSNEYITPVLDATKYYFVSIVNEAGCESSERVRVTAEIKAVPSSEFLVQQINPCDISTNLSLSNVIVGATYSLMQNGQIITSEIATDIDLAIPLTKQQVSDGVNVFDILIEKDGCSTELLDRVEFSYYAREDVESTQNGKECVPGSVSLFAEGAGVGSSYNWYASIDDVDPISSQSNNEFITPPIDVSTSYFVSIVNENGCESLDRFEVLAEIVNLEIPDIMYDNRQGVISTSVEAESYQWYKDGIPIEGETGISYTLLEVGSYHVEVTSNGCSVSSNPEGIDRILGLEELKQLGISIYPNPVVDILKVTNGDKINALIIYDTKGGAVYRSGNSIPHEINLISIKKGIYIINIATDNRVINYRISKK